MYPKVKMYKEVALKFSKQLIACSDLTQGGFAVWNNGLNGVILQSPPS
jgi:hypothetical protein